MGGRFHKIAVAVSFSPRREALLAEAERLKNLFGAQLLIIHVGQLREHSLSHLEALLEKYHLDGADCQLVIEQGGRVKRICELCADEQVDLLVCGAMRRHNMLDYFWGSVAQRLIKQAPCSLLVMAKPRIRARGFKRMVISANEGSSLRAGGWFTTNQPNPVLDQVMERGMSWAQTEQCQQVHVLRESHLYSLAMSTQADQPEERTGALRRSLLQQEISHVERLLAPYRHAGSFDEEADDLMVNIKITSGKPGHELTSFVRKMKADLLVMQAPIFDRMGLFWRLLCPEFEQVLNDLPSNLLLVKN